MKKLVLAALVTLAMAAAAHATPQEEKVVVHKVFGLVDMDKTATQAGAPETNVTCAGYIEADRPLWQRILSLWIADKVHLDINLSYKLPADHVDLKYAEEHVGQSRYSPFPMAVPESLRGQIVCMHDFATPAAEPGKTIQHGKYTATSLIDCSGALTTYAVMAGK